MGEVSVQARVKQQLEGWDYDFSHFSIDDFVAWVALRRKRHIQLVPWSLPPELFGAWIEGEQADYVFYEAEPLHVHTVHIVLHELCHILLGHKTAIVGRDFSRLLQADADASQPTAQQALTGLFRQVSYEDEQEIEAETLSSLIQLRVYQQAGLAALSHTGDGLAMRQFMQGIGMDGAG